MLSYFSESYSLQRYGLWTAVLLCPWVSRQEYWTVLPGPPPGDLPDPGAEPTFCAAPALQMDYLPLSH